MMGSRALGQLAKRARNHRLILLYSTVLMIAGFMVGIFMNAKGIGATPDSVVYIASARSLADGGGLTVPNGIEPPAPMTHFAPLYPAILGFVNWLGPNALLAAKWVSTILLGVLLGLTVIAVGGANSRNKWLVIILAPLLVLAQVDILEIHRYAFSEPIFLVLTIGGLFSLSRYLITREFRWKVAALGGLGLAALARYAGVAAVPTLVLAVFLFGDGKAQKRLLKGAELSFLAMLPLSLWVVRNWIRTGNSTDRGFAYHPITLIQLRRGISTASDWFLPGRITGASRELLTTIVVIGALFMVLLAIRHARRATNNQSKRNLRRIFPAIAGLYALSYTVTLVVSMSFFDAQLSLTGRVLSPLYLLGILSLTPILPLSFRRSGWLLQAIISLAILSVLIFNSIHAVKYVTRSHEGSMMMYTGEGWTGAAIIEQLDRLPPGIPTYSNGDDAIYMVTGRPTSRLPQRFNPFTLKSNSEFDEEMSRMLEVLTREKGVVVYFHGITWRGYLPSRDELKAILPLVELWEGDEGVIYGLQ